MKDWLVPGRYLNEVLTPKRNSEDLDTDLASFAEKYQTTLDHDFVACITDNPMGKPSFEALETLEVTGSPIKPDRLLIHLNTFHGREDLDRNLRAMAENGATNLLVVSGDGGGSLHRLEPDEIAMDCVTVTSIQLIQYIRREFPGDFSFGVAFNHYEPQDHEREKLQRKLDAGATFVVTQPVIGLNPNIDWLMGCGAPVILEAWMSKKIAMVAQCVGYALSGEELNYDPIENLKMLKAHYPQAGFYLSMLGMKKQILQLKDVG